MNHQTHRHAVICDDDFEHQCVLYLPAESVDLEDGDLSGLSALFQRWPRGHSFARSCLYWALLDGSDFSGCNLRECDLRGASLRNTVLVGADLSKAKLGCDNLGGPTRLHGADLRDARLQGCDFSSAEIRPKYPLS